MIDEMKDIAKAAQLLITKSHDEAITLKDFQDYASSFIGHLVEGVFFGDDGQISEIIIKDVTDLDDKNSMLMGVAEVVAVDFIQTLENPENISSAVSAAKSMYAHLSELGFLEATLSQCLLLLEHATDEQGQFDLLTELNRDETRGMLTESTEIEDDLRTKMMRHLIESPEKVASLMRLIERKYDHDRIPMPVLKQALLYVNSGHMSQTSDEKVELGAPART